MKTPNIKMIVPDALGPDDDDQDLRALITVELEDEDAPPCQAVDEFADEFLTQAPQQPGGPNELSIGSRLRGNDG